MQMATVGPVYSPVLPLNGLSETIACWYSELIPRNKVIQNYQSILSPGYPVLLFGSVQDSDAVLKRLGVNYFYVLKQNAEFWGPAFGPSFTADRLAANFDIFWESDEAYILTWRGQGIRPVSSDEAAAIQALRARTATSKLNWERTGWLAYSRLKPSLGKN